MLEPIIRDAVEDDFASILVLNEAFVAFTSPMDYQRVAELDKMCCYHKVVEVDHQVVGFLMAVPPDTNYDSVNYRWFGDRYEQYLYIDRVVIDVSQQGLGIGKLLYQNLFSFAKEQGFRHISCEFDVQPPNPKSAAFHKSFEFYQVGTQSVAGGKKTVSLQVSDI